MGRKYRIVLVEDHRILRDGLRAILEGDPDLEVVCEATDGRDAVRCARDFTPDLVLLDLTLPRQGGLEVLAQIKDVSPRTRVLVLTVHKDQELVFSALREGADGYLVKDESSKELLRAVESMRNGTRYLSPQVASAVVERSMARPGAPEFNPSAFERLTPRERQVFTLAAEGRRNREIAEELCIGVRTVETHRSRLMHKLGLKGPAELAAYAQSKGLITR